MSTLPLETRKRILTGLGYSVREDRVNGHVCYQLLKDGKNANFTARPNAEQAAWESVEIDANFCEREILPKVKGAGFNIRIYNCGSTDGWEVEFEDFNEFHGHSDSLSTAIALAFHSYLEAQP